MGLGVCGVIGSIALEAERPPHDIATGGVLLVKYQPFLNLLWSYSDHLIVHRLGMMLINNGKISL